MADSYFLVVKVVNGRTGGVEASSSEKMPELTGPGIRRASIPALINVVAQVVGNNYAQSCTPDHTL